MSLFTHWTQACVHLHVHQENANYLFSLPLCEGLLNGFPGASRLGFPKVMVYRPVSVGGGGGFGGLSEPRSLNPAPRDRPVYHD